MLEYEITAITTGPARAVAQCKLAEIELDTDPDGRGDAFNPAELFLASLAACMLKGLERMAPDHKFTWRSASVSVLGLRRDAPPCMERIQYELVVDTDESDERLAFMHRNLREFGTISSTIAKAVELTGTARRMVKATEAAAAPT